MEAFREVGVRALALTSRGSDDCGARSCTATRWA